MGSYKSIDMQMKGYTFKIKSAVQPRLRNVIHKFAKTFLKVNPEIREKCLSIEAYSSEKGQIDSK